jgi:hypothetical protein
MIIRVPVQTAVWPERRVGALVLEVGDHVSVVGSYRPPVSKIPLIPPQMTI